MKHASSAVTQTDNKPQVRHRIKTRFPAVFLITSGSVLAVDSK